MIAPAVFLAALSFWAPYNGGVTPCSNDVAADAVYVTFPTPGPGEPVRNAQTMVGLDASAFKGRPMRQPCNLTLSTDLSRTPEAYQAAVIAHEIGHAGMGLEHTEDRANIMYQFQIVPRFFQQAFPRASVRRHPGVRRLRGH
jgi:hypothetical protein